jgi:hypothetical protein
MQPFMPDVERLPPPPEGSRCGPVEHRLLEVEALQQREEPEPEHEQERGLPRAPAAAAQVEGRNEERHAGGHGQGVEERHDLDRLELKQEVVAPGDVRRQRRKQVDEPDCKGDAPGERRQPVGAASLTQRRGAAVQSDPPGGSVPLGRDEVTPVLEDQPAARRCHEQRHEREVPGTRCPPDEVHGEYREPEVPLVDAAA